MMSKNSEMFRMSYLGDNFCKNKEKHSNVDVVNMGIHH